MKTCSLCRRTVSLRKSHIIPEFFFKPLYDEVHRFQWLSTDTAYKDRYEQKGLREKLLCDTCEATISKYETYVSRLFNGDQRISSKREGKLIFLSRIDYKTFKLFLLSILWRAGVSQLLLFRQVSLGPHEEQLRNMLSQGDPGPFDLYPCVVDCVLHDEIPQFGLIVEPSFTRFEGHRCYRFLFGGFAWAFFVSSHGLPPAVKQRVLTEDGDLVIALRMLEELKYLDSFFRKVIEVS